MEFSKLKVAVAKQFEKMQKHTMFRSRVAKDDLWATYLSSFPAGTNELYRKRTEHDCSCCKQFIRAVGNAVAVIDGKLVSVWDVTVAEPGYQVVADALSKLSKAQAIDVPFLHYEESAGTDKNFEQAVDGVVTWNHFFVNIKKDYVEKKSKIDTRLGEERASHDVLLRSLEEISDDAIGTVLELIAQRSLYRGDENKFVLDEFRKLKRDFQKLKTAGEKDVFAWAASKGAPASVARIRNTSIGTLLVNLSESMELDAAVSAFEAMVAPANYKRPTALITKAMIEKAKAKLSELGLTSALERRYAALADITINNVLFADRTTRASLGGDVFDDLASKVSTNTKSLEKVEEVPIDRFIVDILPKADSIEVMFENSHASNLVSLIAPADPTAGLMFKWPNRFSWSYNGEMADSIKERVKKAGGSVVGDLCCRLAWHNHDDLDFWMIEPSGHEIYFGNRGGTSPSGGTLDVDMNAGYGATREPVENIFYANRAKMREGVYTLRVHQFAKRESNNAGFEVEIDYLGTVLSFAHPKAVPDRQTVIVAEFMYSHKEGFKIVKSLPSTQAVRTTWGIQSQTFHKVKAMMLSPNFWDEKVVGNKHYFFMLDGCQNDGTARGFFNEFLKSELDPHRKVFEIVGSKMKAAASGDEQLSGLGFSSTQKNTLLCRVKGSFTRTIKIMF
jgi:hypothetical protein